MPIFFRVHFTKKFFLFFFIFFDVCLQFFSHGCYVHSMSYTHEWVALSINSKLNWRTIAFLSYGKWCIHALSFTFNTSNKWKLYHMLHIHILIYMHGWKFVCLSCWVDCWILEHRNVSKLTLMFLHGRSIKIQFVIPSILLCCLFSCNCTFRCPLYSYSALALYIICSLDVYKIWEHYVIHMHWYLTLICILTIHIQCYDLQAFNYLVCGVG